MTPPTDRPAEPEPPAGPEHPAGTDHPAGLDLGVPSAPAPRPGRPSRPTAKGSNRREELLDVTERVLVDRGNAELSLRTVAAEAGVRLGHLQHYFRTRADLVQAVLARVLARSLQEVADVTGSAGGAVEPVVRSLLAQQEDARLVRLFTEIWALAAHDGSVAAEVRAFYRDYTGHVAEFVRSRDPGLPPHLCRARAETFVMLIEGASLFRSGVAAEASAATDAELTGLATALLGGGPPTGP
ncbi:TetR/AcrR family transcriptional regulator [Planomonospora sp. ID91781]|uniref:TetR/AcrR family transcriptional regulator n=1 Tax=Planomonospora sp. ID91781 TaxID=2738135 RepID=UPI001A1D28A5|nr:TetR/AcrR family transcriptional regulator [Planomonospora sp. ID91781]MBG0821526.1 TetR/AcrR family transcriptional regulator [Planomonospora sp. ID91781]